MSGHSTAEAYDRHAVAVSMLTVCAFALGEAEEWAEEVRESVTQDIRHTLEYAVYLLVEAERKR